MFDIHCHLLPGIDDGAGDMNQSLGLARHAVADGITHMVVTPHIQPGVYNNSLTNICKRLIEFKAALAEQDIALNVEMAAEVRICPEIMPLLDKGELPLYLGRENQKTILLELPHSHLPPGSDNMIRWLLKQKINVLIAHPERNKELMGDIRKVGGLVDMGCMLQLTSGSVAGRFGERVKSVAEEILQRGWAGLLASDAHNLSNRPPQLSDGEAAAALIVGSEVASSLVRQAPQALVEGLFV